MRRVRVRPRFVIFLVVIIAVIIAVCLLIANRSGGEITIDTIRLELTADAVIIRDETIVSTEKYDKIVFHVAEGENIGNDTEVAEVYKWGYQEESTQALIEVQKQILSYAQAQVADIINTEYDAVTTKIDMQLESIRNKDDADLLVLEQDLKDLLRVRNELLKRNIQQDEVLTDLYAEEAEQIASLASWKRSIINTAGDGTVSFYFDGYEQALNADRLDLISADIIRNVLRGTGIAAQSSSTGASKEDLLYRLVDNGHWYIAFLSNSTDPQRVVAGEEYVVYFDEYRDLPFNAVALEPAIYKDKVVNILEFNEDISNLMGVRVASVTIKKEATGIKVPLDAISMTDGVSAIEIAHGTGYRQVVIEVLTSDDKNAIIQTKDVKDALVSGQEYKKN